MEAPPQLSFACPLPWKNMSGDERMKFCSVCGHQIQNLSPLSRQERLALLDRAKVAQVCGSYYVRLSGELVTPDKPLSEHERGKIRQYGAAALSATALAIAAGCVAPKTENAQATPVAASMRSEVKPDAKNIEIEATDKSEDEVVLLAGFIVCKPPQVPKTHGPHTK